jgi:muramidase (phage lysozyme)
MKFLTELLAERDALQKNIEDSTDRLHSSNEELIDNIEDAQNAYDECQNGDIDAALDAIQDAWDEFYGCEYPLHSGDDDKDYNDGGTPPIMA